jgi:quinol monooxygenase YgiN
MKAKPGKEDVAFKELTSLVEITRGEKGCINYDLHRGKEDPSEFMFYENWETMQTLEDHWAAPHLVRLKSIASDLFVAPSDVRLYTITE